MKGGVPVNIALMAHDKKKELMCSFALHTSDTVSLFYLRHDTTGKLVPGYGLP
jgi:methylglyoxal synthase